MEIKFEPNEEGVSTARIKNLKISISLSADRLEYIADIFVYENRIEVPCDYEDCPKNIIHYQNCNFYTGELQHCPYSVEEEQIDSSVSFSKPTFPEVQEKILSMFKNNNDGLGHRGHWPINPANNFMKSKWILDVK